MKVLLIQDVDNLGYAGDVKKVANGYGRNYLIPQQMAILATPGALKQAETIRKTAEKKRAQQTADAEAVANQLAGLELAFERRAGETGKLYGSVTSTDIVEAIQDKTQIEVDRRKVALPEPIRTLGELDVIIKLMIDVSTTVKVTVIPEGGVLEKEHLDEEEVADIEAAAEETTAVEEIEEAATELVEEVEVEVEVEDEAETEIDDAQE
jgi:large subunit ribosomal protein L9